MRDGPKGLFALIFSYQLIYFFSSKVPEFKGFTVQIVNKRKFSLFRSVIDPQSGKPIIEKIFSKFIENFCPKTAFQFWYIDLFLKRIAKIVDEASSFLLVLGPSSLASVDMRTWFCEHFCFRF